MPTHAHRKPQAEARAADPAGHVDWVALWAVSLGLCAVALAGFAYFTIGDKLGASIIMASVAAIIGVVLRVTAAQGQPR